MYDDSTQMRSVNKYLPGAQAWSKLHDNYLEREYRPYGSHTQATIVPFLFLGTYAGIYGHFHKKNIEKNK